MSKGTPSRQAYKVVVIGASSVGKTCLTLQFVKGVFPEGQEPTLGVAYTVQSVIIDNVVVKLEIWDTAGQERFQGIVPLYYRNAKAALVDYDISSWDSFSKASEWIDRISEEVREPIVMVLVGNKTDLAGQRCVTQEEGAALAKRNNLPFFETSAKSNSNVAELFLAVAHRLHLNKSSPVENDQILLRDSGGGEKRACCLIWQ